MAHADTRIHAHFGVALLVLVACLACSSNASEGKRSDGDPTNGAGGQGTSAGGSDGAGGAVSGGDGGRAVAGGGGSGLAGTGGSSSSAVGGSAGRPAQMEYLDCAGPALWCQDGIVTTIVGSGVPRGQSCTKVIYQCRDGCKTAYLPPVYAPNAMTPEPITICGEWDAGVPDAGGSRDAGSCDADSDAGCGAR